MHSSCILGCNEVVSGVPPDDVCTLHDSHHFQRTPEPSGRSNGLAELRFIMNTQTCRLWTFAASLLVGLFQPCLAAESSKPKIAYESHIRPIFKAMCFQCHGEEAKHQGGLDLRLVRLIVSGGDSGSAISEKSPAQSLLWQRIESDEMPEGEKKLSASEKELIRQWIEAGCPTLRPEPENVEDARYTPEELNHWSFKPVQRPPVPTPAGVEVTSAVDAFIADQLVKAGLNFSPEADRQTLIRRLSFDLTGLPPTPEQVQAFVQDESPDAYEKLVDSLLASPHYGERWGRHWLDVAGFAETDGALVKDTARPHAWRYRDYVINAFNNDIPYSQFLTEQLAGDELIKGTPNPDNPEHVRLLAATGFLRMGPDVTNAENTIPNRHQAVADLISIVSTATMGVTVGCAQCHDHRYDPISAEDYYRYRAIFDPALPVATWKRPQERLLDVTPKEILDQEKEIAAKAAELTKVLNEAKRVIAQAEYEKVLLEIPEAERATLVAIVEKAAKDRTKEEQAHLARYPRLHPVPIIQQRLNLYNPAELAKLKGQQKEIDDLNATKPARVMVMGVAEKAGPLPKSSVLFRGDPGQPIKDVTPGELFVIARSLNNPVIPEKSPDLPSSGRRLAYAKILTSEQHPLTARVAVNRLWAHHFGKGIVGTPGDFGLAGDKPTHPELLDWLASELVQGDWRLKRIHKLIVTSRTYKQSSQRTQQLDAIDPENRLLGRMNLRRLDAESIRDAMIAATGKLSSTVGGTSIPVGREMDGRAVIGEEIYLNSLPQGVKDIGDEKFRRSLYVQFRRNVPLTFLDAFDLPVMTPNCQSRKATNVAPQALLLLNDASIIETSEVIARSLVSANPMDNAQQDKAINELFLRLLASSATPEELEMCRQFLAQQTERLTKATDAVWKKRLKDQPDLVQVSAFATLAQSVVATNRFLYVE